MSPARAEFCGAMDGAARFSQRDSLATILIMAINIIAGFSHRRLPAGHSVPGGAQDVHDPDCG